MRPTGRRGAIFLGYALNLGAWSAVFAVPSALVERYIKTAGGDELKVILWLLKNNGRTYAAEDIAAAVGIPDAAAEKAVRFWVENGLLSLSEDALFSTLAPNKPAVCPPAAPPAPAAPRRMLRPDGLYVSDCMETSPDVRRLVDEAEALLGKTLSPALSGTLIQAYADYGLPCEVILMLVAYAAKIGRANTSYIESTVRSWADSDIRSIAAAEERLRELDETAVAWKRCERAFGMTSRRAPSRNEGQYAHRWVIEWATPDALLNEAYNRCVDNTGKMNMKYINTILAAWHDAGIRTPEAAQAERETAAAKRAAPQKPSYDLEAYEKFDIFNSKA